MKKIFIGLLIAAAGAGVYFFVLRKKEKTDTINKEWIIGIWKADAGKDSSFIPLRYEFLTNGIIIRSASDTVKADTLHYEWVKTNELVWYNKTSAEKKERGDSIGTAFTVLTLTQDSLQLQAKDSSAVLFTRMKE
jgi:hypothetical protein